MTAKLFEAALGIADPWFVGSVEFDAKARTLTCLPLSCRHILKLTSGTADDLLH